MICRECGKMVLPIQGHIIDEEFYCEDCTVECQDCGDFVLKESAYELHDGNYVCETCKEDSYYICEDCGELFHSNDMFWVDDEKYVCRDCLHKNYYECECCQKYFSFSNIHSTYDSQFVCNSCIDKGLYYRCNDCGSYVHCDESSYCASEDCDYCPHCADNHSDAIYGYHDFSDFYKLKTPEESNTSEYFGIEIEVSGDKYYADSFLNLMPDVVLMNDSSIVDEGFEIVSQPMTRNYIKENFLPNLENGMAFLRQHNFRGHNYGGIHIHVSREVFSKQMLCVLRNVLYTGYEEDFDVWKAITQRKTSEIQEWCRFNEAKSCAEIMESETEYPHISEDRYTAMNYDSRTNTYEFRIFNSNTRIERIRKNFQTVFSLIDYAKIKANNYGLATTEGYLDFVVANESLYPDLHAFIYEMGIVQRVEEERIAA